MGIAGLVCGIISIGLAGFVKDGWLVVEVMVVTVVWVEGFAGLMFRFWL